MNVGQSIYVVGITGKPGWHNKDYYMKICFVFIAFNPFCTYIFVCVVIKAHILSLNNKLKKKIGLGSSSSYIFFSPGVAVNGAHSGGESSRRQPKSSSCWTFLSFNDYFS
jgi:hypothetical protein